MRYENKIELVTCPFCSVKRPKDWFGPEVKANDRDEKTGKTKRVVKYRKYVGCWRCREIRGVCDLAAPPVGVKP